MVWLVTGGAGYIGAHVVTELVNSNVDVIVLDEDKFSDGRLPQQARIINANLNQNQTVQRIFSDYEIAGVIHIAARKMVGQSIEKPLYYWKENVSGFINLLSAMQAHQVKNLVFSSSAAVYGQPESVGIELVNEEYPTMPINPYGQTKLAGEMVSEAMANSDGLKVAALRYFNVAGAGYPELGDKFASNLVPIVFDAIDRGAQPIVFGDDYSTPDGSCIRDYVHVQDLAEAHVAAMNFVETSEPGFTAINIGTGVGASVFEVLNMIQEVTGMDVSPVQAPRREGDPAALVADVSKAKQVLNWSSSRNLKEIIESAWEAWQFQK
jgi:UDP-glucose 4-epimerase